MRSRICLYCRQAESDDVDWVQCEKCQRWAHFSCAGVDSEIVNINWSCQRCKVLSVPDTAPKRRGKKSVSNSDAGSDRGGSSVQEPTEKQLEEEQLAMEMEFAKQMDLRKARLERQQAWNEFRLKQEREMRKLEHQAQRKMEEQQLEHEQEMLDRQMAAEREFLQKRDAIRKQFDNSVMKVKALKDQSGPVRNSSMIKPTKMVNQWLHGDNRGAHRRMNDGEDPKRTGMGPVDDEGDSEWNHEVSDGSDVSEVPRSRNNRSRVRLSEGTNGSGCRVGRITRDQLAARKAVSQNLPKFKGEPEVWPLFISSFEFTTAACGFSNLENLKRLQDCLQGDALEAVRSRLILPDSVPDVIGDLRNLFGRPEKLLKSLLSKVRSAPAPRADRLETFLHFGITVKQLCDHLEAARLNDHLNNPMLVQELVDKLPPSYKLDWVRYKRGKVDSSLRMFTNFINDIVSDVSEVTEFSALSMSDAGHSGRGNLRKKEFVHLHDSDQKRTEVRNDTVSKQCWICKRTDHLIKFCEDFKRMNVAERLREVERHQLCSICLNKHGNSWCTSKIRCMVRNCKGSHHSLLHRVKESVRLQKVECNTIGNPENNVIFRMMPVTLYVGERQFDTVAFLDEGSSATLVDDVVAKRLKARGTVEPLIVTWTGNINRYENDSMKVELMMSAKGSKDKYSLFNTRTVSELVLPRQNVRFAEVVKRYSHLTGVPVKNFPSGKPRILLGLDNIHLFAPLESRVGKPNEPIAVRSKIGWTVYGTENSAPSAHTYLNLHSVEPMSNQYLHDMLREQYVLDETAVTTFAIPEPVEDKRAREILESTTKRVGDRYETGLLWREDARRFPDSYSMAVRRMKALDRKLEKSPELKRNVCLQIEDYQVKGYTHKATKAELTDTPRNTVWYLLLNVVVNPRKPGKIRLVWDAAASVNGVSLNSELLKGPDMLVPLPRVICHFRERPVAFEGDIQEMYHQILIRSEDKQAQWFLFHSNAEESPQVYVMDVATFGPTCSPCSAQYVKNLNAERFVHEYPAAVEAIVRRHYVDDYYDSVDTLEEAVQRANEVKYIHSCGGFHIRNWVSNSANFLEELGEQIADSAVHFNRNKSTEHERVLGITWDPVQDVFYFASISKSEYNQVLRGEEHPTKRVVLSIVMAQFDPVGLLVPVTILGKMLVQDLWRTGCEWDETIDDLSFKKWLRWTNILLDVESFRLPRSYFGNARSEEIEDVQLHIFADASETAYGCVAYFRAIVRGKVVCSLVISRAKVAPLKQLSIPRLELQAAVLGARLSKTVQDNHNFSISRVVFWIDAEVVLSWIRSDQRRYKQFVGFRIGEILSLTKLTDWYGIPTRLNIADQITKWGKDPEIHPNSPWVRGQPFLYNVEDWPKKAYHRETPLKNYALTCCYTT
ncbi:uncharacterized protein LOC131429046 [Malaya genurostris]|uniref:uncharacterized protein LOC131429046 n=1 Tax=Malaya genurostris TaxID=325434 RepID=UPI0026F3C43B|nr:uncharacterized protein LOC131429046 [Malaya genurostris]